MQKQVVMHKNRAAFMRAKSLTPKQVQERLKKAKEKDVNYQDGKVLCSLCTTPLEAAKQAHQMFLDTNLGDPGLFQGTSQLEKEAIAELSGLLHGKTSVGFIVSGGTEANLLALYAARERVNISNPEVIIPQSAHFSFTKIARMLKIKLVQASLNESFQVNIENVEQLITENTIAIVANAGSVELGAIDNVSELSKIAQRHQIPLHVDAAFGGLIIPFLKELGYNVPEFDFVLDGVQSITVDPHKMGLSTVPAGGILFRNANILEYIKTPTPYLTADYQYTFAGTRPGACAAATWAAFASLGREGFKKIVTYCINLANFLYEGLEEAGFEVLLRPQLNIVSFRSANSKLLVDKLRNNGWLVSYVPRLDAVRIVLMPHTTKQHLTDFITCLKQLEP
jgi:tyrosine decarboxylase/aspartate 1-decarboxylase